MLQRLKPRVLTHTYRVYLQSGHLTPVGTVEAHSGEEAIAKAKKEYRIGAPVVQRIEFDQLRSA